MKIKILGTGCSNYNEKIISYGKGPFSEEIKKILEKNK